MKTWILIALLVPLVVGVPDGWALLYCGTVYWEDYGQYVELYHTYHILRSIGIPHRKITTFVASTWYGGDLSPFPGTLYHKPGNNPRDWKVGVQTNYDEGRMFSFWFHRAVRGTGNCYLGDHCITAEPYDTVFLAYFGQSIPECMVLLIEIIHIDQLLDDIIYLKEEREVYRVVLFLDTEHSKSMADYIMSRPPEAYKHLYVVTSLDREGYTNPKIWCPPDDDVVNGQHIGTCLATTFGYYYTEHFDLHNSNDTWINGYRHIAYGYPDIPLPGYFGDYEEMVTTRQGFNVRWWQADQSEFFHPRWFEAPRPDYLDDEEETGANNASEEMRPKTLEEVEAELKEDIRKHNSAKKHNKKMEFSDFDNGMAVLENRVVNADSEEKRAKAKVELEDEKLNRIIVDRFFKRVLRRNVPKKRRAEMMEPITKTIVNRGCYLEAVNRAQLNLPTNSYKLKYYVIFANICDKLGKNVKMKFNFKYTVDTDDDDDE